MTLRRVMRIRKMTQKRLADACGVSQGAVSYWVTGEYMPHAKVASTLVKELDAQISWESFVKGKLDLRLK